MRADGSEALKLTWPVVRGAKGYLCNITLLDDPENPVKYVTDSLVDGCSFIFDRLEDAKYEIEVKTVGDPELNNKDSQEVSTLSYTTLVDAVIVPEGEELSSWIAANIKDTKEEQGFELLPGATYTLDNPLDFGLYTVTLRGNRLENANVILGNGGKFVTQGGLRIKYINFDCTEATSIGVLELSTEPDPSISNDALGYKADGATSDGFVIEKPVAFTKCNFKNIHKSLLYGSKKNWSLFNFSIENCIVQLDADDTHEYCILHLHGAGNGLIKNMTLKNSTFLNLYARNKGAFLRYSNSSQAQPKRIFGNKENSVQHIITNCTFVKTFTGNGWGFANNMTSQNVAKLSVHHNIFYDVYRLQKYMGNCTKIAYDNIMRGVTNSVDNTDKTSYVTEYPAFEFEDNAVASLDFTKPNCGLKFKPLESDAISKKIGDPRWFE